MNKIEYKLLYITFLIMSQPNMSQSMSQSNTPEFKFPVVDWAALDENNCNKLQSIFHISMLMGILPHMDTSEKMMNMLNARGDPRWTACYICELATDNKIEWVQGLGDPKSYETYKSDMNYRLAQILQ